MNKLWSFLLSLMFACMPLASLSPNYARLQSGHFSRRDRAPRDYPLFEITGRQEGRTFVTLRPRNGAGAGSRSPATKFTRGAPTDASGELNVEVKLDDKYIKKVLGTKVGALFASQLETDDPACRAAAVLVSQEAVNNYAYWTAFIDLLKETGKGIELGGKLSGAKTVTKAGQLAFTIAEALEDEEPAAALGRAMITESTDWLAGKSKADIKKEAGDARDAMIKALFPGVNKKGKDYKTTVGNCSITVTPEFQWPDGTKGSVGGLWLRIHDADCKCKKPLRLDSEYSIPTTFHGQTPDIKNCGLGRFQLNAFLPMKKLETSVSYAGNAITLAEFGTKAKNLKEAVEKALKGEKSDMSPGELSEDLVKLTDKATTVEPTLILTPVFADQLDLKDLYAKCNNCSQPGTETTGNVTETPPVAKPIDVPDAVCGSGGSRCGTLYNRWIALQGAAIPDKKARKTDEQIANELTAAQREMNDARRNLDEANAKLTDIDAKLAAIQAEAKRKGLKASDFPSWESYQQAKINTTSEIAGRKVRLKQKSDVVDDLQTLADYSGKTQAEKKRMADEAKAAYFGCARCCWSEALLGHPNAKVPDDVKEWGRKHQIDCGLIGTWRSESLAYQWQDTQFRGGSGIIMTIESDGRITIDYSQMQAMEYEHGGHRYKERWKGTSVGRIVSGTDFDFWKRTGLWRPGDSSTQPTFVSLALERSELGYEGTDTDDTNFVKPVSNEWVGFGPVGGVLTGRTMKIGKTTLTCSEDNPGPSSMTITFKRVK